MWVFLNQIYFINDLKIVLTELDLSCSHFLRLHFMDPKPLLGVNLILYLLTINLFHCSCQNCIYYIVAPLVKYSRNSSRLCDIKQKWPPFDSKQIKLSSYSCPNIVSLFIVNLVYSGCLTEYSK